MECPVYNCADKVFLELLDYLYEQKLPFFTKRIFYGNLRVKSIILIIIILYELITYSINHEDPFPALHFKCDSRIMIAAVMVCIEVENVIF